MSRTFQSSLKMKEQYFSLMFEYGCFHMTAGKLIPKILLRPITTGANSAVNQLEFLAIINNLLKARGKLRVQGVIGFACHWLKTWREIFLSTCYYACASRCARACFAGENEALQRQHIISLSL